LLRLPRKVRDRLASPACVDNTYRNVVKEHKSLLGKFSIRALSERFVSFIDSKLNEPRGEQVPAGGGIVLPENLGEGVRPAHKTLALFITKICDFPYPT